MQFWSSYRRPCLSPCVLQWNLQTTRSTKLISLSRLKGHSSDPLFKPNYLTTSIMASKKKGKTAPVTLPASNEIDLDSASSDQSIISSSDSVSQVGNMSLRNDIKNVNKAIEFLKYYTLEKKTITEARQQLEITQTRSLKWRTLMKKSLNVFRTLWRQPSTNNFCQCNPA